MNIGFAKTYDFRMLVCFAFMYALLAYLHNAYFHLISNMQIVRTFKNRIPIQTFQKWNNISYRYVSCVKSETSDIWRTAAWFLKPFGERVEKNHIYNLVKPNSTIKARRAYRGCNVCYQVFL